MKTGNSSFIFWFEELGQEHNDLVGKKCANLGEMTKRGLPVPPGFALSVDAYKSFISLTGAAREIKDYLEKTGGNVQDIRQVQKGEVLVAPATSADWTHVFPYIKAVVADTEGMLAHAPIISREFGIPCVSNVKVGTQVIKTGQRIRVDGNAGAVWILDKKG